MTLKLVSFSILDRLEGVSPVSDQSHRQSLLRMRERFRKEKLTLVHHDLGVRSGKDDQSDRPLGVPQLTPSQQQLVDRDRFLDLFTTLPLLPFNDRVLHSELLLARPILQHGAVRVQVGVRRLAVDPELRVFNVLLVADPHRRLEGLARLQVGLAVEVLGLDEADTVRVRRRQDDHVGRDLVVLLEQDHVADFELFPERALPSSGPRSGLVVRDHVRRLCRAA